MFADYSKIPIKLGILLVGFGLLVAGCDTNAPGVNEGDTFIEVTNDLGERINTFGNGESNAVALKGLNGPKTSPKFTLRTRAQIEPPTSVQSASHLLLDKGGTPNDLSDDRIFVGYKVPGAAFGGGVDILDASNPTNLGLGDQSLRSPDLDVQEVAFDGNGNLYIAGAVDFGNVPARDFGNTPAALVQVDINTSGGTVTFPGSGGGGSDVSATEVAMPNRLVKGLALGTSGSARAVYAITDSSAVYGFRDDLSGRQVASVGSSSNELRSISSFGSQSLHALDTFGDLFMFNLGDPINIVNGGSAVNQTNLGDPGDFSISRLQTTDVSGIRQGNGGNLNTGGDDFLHFVGMNEGNGNGGIRVLSQNGDYIRYGTNFQAYVTVTGAVDSNGDLRVFAGSPGGTIDVFQGADGLQWTAENPGSMSSSEALQAGLELQGSFDISGLSGDVNLSSAQINQIEFHETQSGDQYLYVATSTEGVVVLEITNGSDLF